MRFRAHRLLLKERLDARASGRVLESVSPEDVARRGDRLLYALPAWYTALTSRATE